MSTTKTASKLKAKDPKAAEPSKPKVLIFGKPGVGKTWTALDFPGCYYIDTEGGADLAHYTDKLKRSGGVYMGPKDGSLDFETVIEQFRALSTERHEFRTVIVDSISKLFNHAIAQEAERLGDKDAFGASKKAPIAQMRRLVSWVNRLDMNVIFIAHATAEWGKDAKSGERTEIGQTFDAWSKLEYELHLALEIFKVGPSRKARVRKSRLQGFPDAETFDWSYEVFADKYGREIIEGAVKSIVLASAESVLEAQRLIKVTRVTEEDVSKWLAKAGVETLEEMEAETMAKIIEHLQRKEAASN